MFVSKGVWNRLVEQRNQQFVNNYVLARVKEAKSQEISVSEPLPIVEE